MKRKVQARAGASRADLAPRKGHPHRSTGTYCAIVGAMQRGVKKVNSRTLPGNEDPACNLKTLHLST